MQSSEAWLTSLIPSRLALCNTDHIIMSILFSLVINGMNADKNIWDQTSC